MADNPDSSSDLNNIHRVAAAIAVVFGVIAWIYEVVNNGISRPYLLLFDVILILGLVYFLLRSRFQERSWFKSPYRKTIEQIILIIEICLAFPALYSIPETGFNTQFIPPFIEPAKDLWDWLGLLGVLAVPVAVALIGYLLQSAERQIAEERLREQRLQDYLDRMTELILEKGLISPNVSEEVKAVARARTLATLRSLDGDRKGELIRFLYEADLISTGEQETFVRLADADISQANLKGVQLRTVNLERVNLKSANLESANLEGAILRGANLERTNLLFAKLSEANLEGANLKGARLVLSNLLRTNLAWAKLGGANLSGALLSGARLDAANLSSAILERAKLYGAVFEWAILYKAKVTPEQLATAILNEDTILPDGSKWKPPVSPTPPAETPPPSETPNNPENRDV